jgi:hypothetical protein
MSKVLTVELSDRVYSALEKQAKITGLSISEVAANSLEERHGSLKKDERSGEEKEAARKRFRSHAGSITKSILEPNQKYITDGNHSSLDNDRIDAELAREYTDSHEETYYRAITRYLWPSLLSLSRRTTASRSGSIIRQRQ